MDWSEFLPILIGILAAIGLPLALRSRKKECGLEDAPE